MFLFSATSVIGIFFLLNGQLLDLLAQEKDISHVINVSGRQRMLSQNIAKTALLILEGEEKEELIQKLDSLRELFIASHNELLATNTILQSKKIDRQFDDIKPSLLGMDSLSGQIQIVYSKVEFKKKLLLFESSFLPLMDAIVSEYEKIAMVDFFSTSSNIKFTFRLMIFSMLTLGGVSCFLAIRINRKYSDELSRKSFELDTAKVETEKAKLKEQFAYVASHDLQEPVRTISSLTDMMLDSQSQSFNGENIQVLQFIKQSCNRMSNQIKGLLAYSRIGKSQRIKIVDLNLLIEEVIQDLDFQIQKSKALIVREKMPSVLGYQAELRSLFQNLISNALKFSKDTEPLNVTILSKEDATHWIFSVEDNGIGLDTDSPERVFHLFQRLNTQNSYPGMGVGLALCKHIVELHKGEISVDSAPGLGSTFTFSISKRI